MALHDLKSLGVSDREELPAPLPSTTTLIAYLYWISVHGNPLSRLGYSYWAERSYEYIRPLLELLSSGFGLKKEQMTFLDQHAKIDERHSREVDDVIQRYAKSPADWEAIREVLVNSLVLTGRMMDEIFFEFVRLKEGHPSRYEWLRLLTR
jgi:pyrroloquinoline quinone (PQQ) biosynthesis protein C